MCHYVICAHRRIFIVLTRLNIVGRCRTGDLSSHGICVQGNTFTSLPFMPCLKVSPILYSITVKYKRYIRWQCEAIKRSLLLQFLSPSYVNCAVEISWHFRRNTNIHTLVYFSVLLFLSNAAFLVTGLAIYSHRRGHLASTPHVAAQARLTYPVYVIQTKWRCACEA